MESDLHQAECHEEELEKKRKGAEEQISLLSEKIKMIHDVLDHQQVELKKSKVYNELLENKHKVCEVYSGCCCYDSTCLCSLCRL